MKPTAVLAALSLGAAVASGCADEEPSPQPASSSTGAMGGRASTTTAGTGGADGGAGAGGAGGQGGVVMGAGPPAGYVLTDGVTGADVTGSMLGDALDGAGSFQITGGDPTRGDTVDDATAPGSPPSVLRVLYPQGFPSDGLEPWVATTEYDLGESVYLRYHARLSTGFQGHSSGVNKQLFLWMDSPPASGTAIVYTALRFDGAASNGRMDALLEWTNPGVGPGGPRWTSDEGIAIDVPIDAWTTIELFADIPTERVAVWVNGQPMADVEGVQFPDGARFTRVQIAPTWGGVGGPAVAADQYLFVDELQVWRRP